jgi:hypothetical protein
MNRHMDKLYWHRARSVTPSVQEGILYGLYVFTRQNPGSGTFLLSHLWLNMPSSENLFFTALLLFYHHTYKLTNVCQ